MINKKRILIRLIEKGMTAGQFAKMIRWSPSKFSSLCNGRVRPTETDLKVLGKTLGLPVKQLLQFRQGAT